MSAFLCRTCGSTLKSKAYAIRETMFGSQEQFVYDQCGTCESIQISEPLDNDELSKHYPKGYYSFNARPSSGITDAIAAKMRTERDRGIFGRSLVGRLIETAIPELGPVWVVRHEGVREDQKILDVGCGGGFFLDRLARLGYRNLSGADPFLDQDAVTGEGIRLNKCVLAEVEGKFDVITFNHSFEHLANPECELRIARQKLRPNGLCLIQTPTPSSLAWDEYGTNWEQLDAPRHLTLMSRKGVPILAAKCGFQLRRIIDLGQSWSLMMSELNRRGVQWRPGRLRRHFSPFEKARYRRKAFNANKAGRGNTVAYVLVAQ